RDPAMLAPGIVGCEEFSGDVGDQRLEADVPAEFLGVDRAVARDHPADVAGPAAAQEEAGRLLRRRLQGLFDCRHRLHDRGTLCGIETGEQSADLVARAALEL